MITKAPSAGLSAPLASVLQLGLAAALACACKARSEIELFPGQRLTPGLEAGGERGALGPGARPAEGGSGGERGGTSDAGRGGNGQGGNGQGGNGAGPGVSAGGVPGRAGAGGRAAVAGDDAGAFGGSAGAVGGAGAAGEAGDRGGAGAAGAASDAGAFPVEPLHRYRFDGTGAVAIDDVSGGDGVIVGGAVLDGEGVLVLDGNDDYVDLPNGLVSSLAEATFSAWLEWNGNNCWHRIFSFGSTLEGEDLVGDRETELLVTPLNCVTPGMLEGYTALFELADNAPGQNAQLLSGVSFGRGVKRHVALGVDAAGEMRLYLDGARVATTATGLGLSDLRDLNNWLGRSQWQQDFNLPGVYDSFEIYDVALSDEDVLALFESGPR